MVPIDLLPRPPLMNTREPQRVLFCTVAHRESNVRAGSNHIRNTDAVMVGPPFQLCKRRLREELPSPGGVWVPHNLSIRHREPRVAVLPDLGAFEGN